MTAPGSILDLVDRFQTYKHSYKSASYNETQLRREFVDPFLKGLGWDIDNQQGQTEAFKEVIHEYTLRIGANIKAPDYAFRIGGERKFFLETKRPSINIKDGIGPAYQLRRYGWSAKLPLSILTDFEEFAIYDCRIKPRKGDKASIARADFFTFEEYAEKWDEIESIFSRDAVAAGSLEKFALDNKRKRGTVEIDDAFLGEIENWREQLARDMALRNSDLSVRELNYAVQRIIDRIIFLRIAEDRGIESDDQLHALKNSNNIYRELTKLFQKADLRYNSGLFHFRKGDGPNETLDVLTLDLAISDDTLEPILGSLYFPESPYEFSVLPADILGQVYERFLGKVIRLSENRAVIEEKPEVKKAGGVFYTPTYIVRYIVKATLGTTLKDKTPLQASGLDRRIKSQAPLRVLDPACGSGSFLIEAYQYLLDWYLKRYVDDDPGKHAKGKSPRLRQAATNDWRLTIAERRRILLTHIFGVDIDPQAVEVTKLSLLLKVLENETADAMASQMDFFNIRALPNLGQNIRCGNSLISSNFFSDKPLSLFSEDDQFRINTFDWRDEFTFLEEAKGFDIVIGNPPWISLTGKFGNATYSRDERDYLIQRYEGNSYMPNMYEYFISKGLELLTPNGYFSFIVPDRFGYNDQFRGLRKKVLNEFALLEVLYRAPFPHVTVDTAIFTLAYRPTKNNDSVRLGEFGKSSDSVSLTKLRGDERSRFDYSGGDQSSRILEKIASSRGAKPLKEIVSTTSGVGARSSAVSRHRISNQQMEILKGASIQKYGIKEPLYFEFKRENITGRTTDRAKLGFRPKLLIRKTGNSLIAAYDGSGMYPEQSLYFTFGESSEPLPYLLGLLNSKLMQFVFFNRALTNRESIAQVKKVDLDALPIHAGVVKSEAIIEKISSLAMHMTGLIQLARKDRTEQSRKNTARRMKATERAMDDKVFDLYGLSAEERKYVIEWGRSRKFGEVWDWVSSSGG